MLKKILLLILIIFLTPLGNTTFSDDENNANLNLVKVYDDLYKKIKIKHRADGGLQYLYTFRTALNNILDSNKVSSKNYQIISSLQKLNNEKIFEIEYNKQTDEHVAIYNKYPDLVNYFKIFSFNDANIFIENGVWYAYTFAESLLFDDPKYLNTGNFKNNNFTENTLVIYNEDIDKVSFVVNYKKVKLISNDIIYGFPDKYELLESFKKYEDNAQSNDADYRYLKKVSTDITKGLYKNDDKIAAIYNYILENVEYTMDDPSNYHLYYSGLKTFRTKKGVCLGYTNLFDLMLGFNDIPSETMEGDVINSENYPEILHAWIKVMDYYYDPTFDDPIGQKSTLKKEDYLFYKLPKELFYADRFDFKDKEKNKSLENTSLEYREELVNVKLAILYPKYKDQNYNILAPYKFKDKYGIPLKSEITLDNLKTIMTYGQLNENKLTINGETKSVKKMNYLTIKENNIEDILKNYKYNIDGVYLLEWTKTGQPTQYIILKDSEIEY